MLNIKDFGAVGDGIADDSAAIKAAVNAAVTPLRKAVAEIYAPAGVYRITQSGAMTQNVIDHAQGVTWRGEGPTATIFRLDAGSSDVYFYDNGSTPRMQFCRFENIGFEGMDPAACTGWNSISDHAKGFRLWASVATGSHEQGFVFKNCHLGLLSNVFETEGDNCASENRFFGCEIYNIKNSVLRVNNGQSFNHEFYGCNLSVIFGDAFVLQNGGSVKMYGGSVILDGSKGTYTYFLKVNNSSGIGGYPTEFNGLRMELRGNTTKLAWYADLVQMAATFRGCLFEDQATTQKAAWCSVASYGNVLFDGCNFYEMAGNRILFESRGAWGYGQSGAIVFQSCHLDEDWSDRCSASNGRITARDCFGSVQAMYPAFYAHDFDLGGSFSDNNQRLKTAYIMLPSTGWPLTGWEPTLKLPKNATIKNIHVRKPAGSTNTTTCTIKIGRNDKSLVHLTTNSAQYKLAQSADVTNYFFNVGTTDNERTLRIFASVPLSGGNIGGGFALVEYY